MKAAFSHTILSYTVCIGAIIGYGFWYAIVEAKSAAVADLENRIAQKAEGARYVSSARASLAEISDDEAQIRSYFVPETGVVAFIDDLEKQGRAQGADMSVLSVSASESGASPTLTFVIAVKGTFDSVMRTIGGIEHAPYDLSVSAFSLALDKVKKDWRADLTLLVGSMPAGAEPQTP